MLTVEPVDPQAARRLCQEYHYSNIFPPHCLVYLGFSDYRGLAGVALWGWGVRPRHTIRRLFPSLDTQDYWELNRLCCRDDLPRNTESQLLSACVSWFHQHQPEKELLFTWSDGIRGKPGYVYQSANWLYGGFITTEIYLTDEGEPVHPRLLITRFGSRSKAVWAQLGLKKLWGRQFRYGYFLCGHRRRKQLLRESPMIWTRNYPKAKDLVWDLQTADEVSREIRNPPRIERAGRFRQSAFESKQPVLFEGI